MGSVALATGATLVDIACDAELVKLAKSLGKFVFVVDPCMLLR